jgi:hypothetical protein
VRFDGDGDAVEFVVRGVHDVLISLAAINKRTFLARFFR